TRDTVRSSRAIVGRVVKNPIPSTQPISTNDLYPPNEGPLPDLEPGMRSVAVQVSGSTSAIAGQYVDVHFTPSSDPEASRNGGRSMTLFKGVRVMAVNGSTSPVTQMARGGANVTLELTP